MACEGWREKLDAYIDGELLAAESGALMSHLRGCPACATETLERVQLKRSVALAGKRYQPDAEFRARIAQNFGEKAERESSWFWKIVLMPAMIILLMSVGLSWYMSRGKADRQRVYSELADLHVATLASGTPVDVVSTDRHTVKPWFAGKIPFTFNLPELQGTDFTLIGGRVTYLEQMPGAHLIYGIRKHEISVFIFQDRDRDAASSTSTPVQMLSFNVASWTQNGLRYFVIGDVGANDLESLSKLLRDAK
jgi:Predicted transmembrane transcriptional regulator (anti-sigma factor)